MSDPVTREMTEEQWRYIERRRIARTRRTLVIILVVLVLLLLIASVALIQIFQPVGGVANSTDSTGLTWVRSIYGWGKSPSEQLQGPQGVAIGPDGVIWATDQGYCRVVGFNPDGSYAGMMYLGFRNDPRFPDAMQYPTSVAVDSDNTIYIGDQSGNQVYVMTRNNKLIRKIYVPTPQAVAVSNDRLVVGAASGFVIMSKTGSVIKVLGSQGTRDDQFMGVRGLAIDKNDNIFVVDQYNNRISEYDRNGNRKWIQVMGPAGNQKPVAKSTQSVGANNMQLPAEACFDGAGRLIVIDPFGFDIVALDPNQKAKPTASYGEAGAADGKFTYPSGIAYDPARDWFAVADTMNGRVEIIRLPHSGGSALSGVTRSLSGPLRACFLPLLIIILVIIAGIIWKIIKRRQEKREEERLAEAAEAEALAAAQAQGGVVPVPGTDADLPAE